MENGKTALTNVQDYLNVNEQFFEKLEALSNEEMQTTDAEYLEFTEGDVHNLIFTGFEAGKFESEEREMVCFTGKNSWKFVNSNSVILNAMKKIVAPCPVRIVCTGEMKNAKGNKYKTFKIFTL